MNYESFIGKAHVFGDNINTDLISPSRYMEEDTKTIAKHAMEGVSPGFSDKIKDGDILVAGKNFGSGSSRETAPAALLGCGLSVVIASSFARIFFRNCINIGLPVMICELTREISDGDELEVSLSLGIIHNISTNKSYSCQPLPSHVLNIIENGGLLGELDRRFADSVQHDSVKNASVASATSFP